MKPKHFYLGPPTDDSQFQTFFSEKISISSTKGVRIAERLLFPFLPQLSEGKILTINSSQGILPAMLRFLHEEKETPPCVVAFYSEAVDFQKAKENFQRSHLSTESVEFCLAPEPFPEERATFDHILLPLQHTIELDLAREWILRATQLLKIHGKLWVSLDSRKKNQVETILRKGFKSIEVESERAGKVWIAEKKAKDTPPNLAGMSSYTVKDGERIVTFQSIPGVFAHGRIDEGARALLKVLEVKSDDFLLDLGCGAGEIGIMAALRAPEIHVVLADSNTRATKMAQINANTLIPGRAEVVLSPNIGTERQDSFSLIVTNPPYFSHYRISQLFLESIQKLLKTNGRFYLVTKQSEWHRKAIEEQFQLDQEFAVLGYSVFLAHPKTQSVKTLAKMR